MPSISQTQRAKAVIGARRNIPPATDGRSVPKDDSPDCSRLIVLRPLGMANWSIRRAKQRDATALADCIDAAYAIYASRISDLPAVSEGIAKDIENNVVWVAEQDDNIVGGMVLVLKKNYVVLANVAVDPIATGTGLGRAFTELAKTESRRLGRVKLRLSTHVDMPENVSLYEHLGWQEAGRSGNKVHMEKTLDLSGG
jgi:N-acetylglutamate synthase-like GNAT family acetyltransferase